MKKSKFFKCVDNKPIDDGLIKRVPIKATLVVMPSLLIQQWTTELARHAPCLKVLVYEGAEATGGSGKGVCAKDLAEQDVVLMNFETLQRELAERGGLGLCQRDWIIVHAADARPLSVRGAYFDGSFDGRVAGPGLRHRHRGPGHRARAPHRPVRAGPSY